MCLKDSARGYKRVSHSFMVDSIMTEVPGSEKGEGVVEDLGLPIIYPRARPKPGLPLPGPGQAKPTWAEPAAR
ncbi:hypothetical protein QC762_0030780 [Podospora pseudocomata]|uniref:Uncharacterized protein n=1 Tax=Podospora pseudocomata TaxID=2093779 RepID=A0ABR0GPM5_9PEZI|nr:hypothetical protein QC762_0030780 [Podospora pseudocomata]